MLEWMKNHKRIRIGVLILLFLLFIIIMPLILNGIYYLKDYNNGHISYKGRTYIKSSVQVMNENMKKGLNETKPTGKYILGNEIYDLPNNPNHSTVIFLRTRNGRFENYSISGGP